MESGGHNGVQPSNDDQKSVMNGANEGGPLGQGLEEKGKEVAGPIHQGANGVGGESSQVSKGAVTAKPPSQPRMNDLPDEINHVTQGFIPLSTILIRLAQATHDDLQKAIVDAANIKWMPPALNGNSANGNDLPEDNSEGNRKRKTTLLKFAQDAHTKWVKALVIADWSRKASSVSKLIDLKAHLDGKRILFDYTLNDLIGLKRDLGLARLPRPDMKTALQVLTTGEAPWIPEPGYLPLPTLTPEEQLKWIEELNTLLSVRLNLDDYDKIPPQFKNYDIQSGRVIFKVKGEFEVDLTIADEDFEKQFWFIDFRFDFAPATGKVSDALMNFIESCVNDTLGKDGLQGCYRFLHEFVLTHKINELKRQTMELSRGTWAGNLKVEPLNRALAIRYWTSRYPPNAPKSWVMVAVHSGKEKNGRPDPKHPSYLVARWYRDNKEIKDVDLDLCADDLSATSLLKSAIAKHVEHILSSIHAKLASAPRFVKREAFMKLSISRHEPLQSSLEMQLGLREKVTLIIEPVTGFAAVQPHTRYALSGENRLNHSGKDPAEDGVTCLENIRWGYVIDEFNRRGRSSGWAMTKSPINGEDVKRIIKTREQYYPVFFQRQGLGQDWFVMLSLSLSGDEWWLLQTAQNGSTRSLRAHTSLPLTKGQPDLNDGFWNNLTVFAGGMITHTAELGELHKSNIRYKGAELTRQPLPQKIRIPSIRFRLSAILSASASGKHNQSRVEDGEGPSWAEDCVEILYKGVRNAPRSGDAADSGHMAVAVDAMLTVKDRSKFKQLQARIDRDVAFNKRTGRFTFHVRGIVGRSVLWQLQERIKSVDRLVGFLDAIRGCGGSIRVREVGLRRVKFSYDDVAPPGGSEDPKQWTAIIDMSQSDIRLTLDEANPHLRILDHLNKLANRQDNGLAILMNYMTQALPVLKAFEVLESRWEELDAENKGHITFLPRGTDSYCIRYDLQSPGSEPLGPTSRSLLLDVRNKNREGTPFWFVTRREKESASPGDDPLSPVLKAVWDSRGEEWRGVSTGAAAPLGKGVFGSLLAVDDAIRTHVENGGAIGPNNAADAASSTMGPQSQLSQPFSSQGTGASGGTQPTAPSQGPPGSQKLQAQGQQQKAGAQKAAQQKSGQKAKPTQAQRQQQGQNKGGTGGQNSPVVVLD